MAERFAKYRIEIARGIDVLLCCLPIVVAIWLFEERHTLRRNSRNFVMDDVLRACVCPCVSYFEVRFPIFRGSVHAHLYVRGSHPVMTHGGCTFEYHHNFVLLRVPAQF